MAEKDGCLWPLALPPGYTWGAMLPLSPKDMDAFFFQRRHTFPSD